MNGYIITCSSCGAKNRIPEKRQHLHPRCGTCKHPLAIGAAAVPVALGDDDFDQFVSSATLPVVVDFFSPGCGPCRVLAPVLKECAGRYLGRVIIAVVDTSRYQRIAGRYRIKGVPTLIIFNQGREVDRMVGAPSRQELLTRLDGLAR